MISAEWLAAFFVLLMAALGACGLVLFHRPSALRGKARLPQAHSIAAPFGAASGIAPRWKSFVPREQFLLLATPVLAGACVAATLALSDRYRLDPLRASPLAQADAIHLRLTEETLVPPPLPPSLFSGTGRAGLESADRDWKRLDANFVQLVLKLISRMEARGYPMVLLEGYRTPERQDQLARMGANVSSARAWQSRHQFGLAADLAPMRDGRLVISERDSWASGAYRALGEEAEALGLEWGGRWRNQDYGHVEAPGSVSSKAIPRQKR